MAIQIADSVVVSKVERLVKATGLSETAVVDMALDRLCRSFDESHQLARRLAELCTLVGRMPSLEEIKDPLKWHEQCLSKQGPVSSVW